MTFESKNEVIHCIGDSHTSLFSGHNKISPYWPEMTNHSLSQFRVYHLGPALAFSLWKNDSKTRSKDKLIEITTKVLPQNSKILMCFGEIDCRAHLIKIAKEHNRSWSEIAEKCILKYFDAISYVSNLGHNIIIYNAIPSSRKNKPNTGFPTYGNCKERNEMTKIFNSHLKKNCDEHGIPFLNTFDCFVHDSGLTNRYYYKDRIHLSQRAIPKTMKALEDCLPAFVFNEKYFRSSLSSRFLNIFLNYFGKNRTTDAL